MKEKLKILHINTVDNDRNGVGQIVNAIHNNAYLFGFSSSLLTGNFNSLTYKLNVLKSRLWDEDGFLVTKKTKRLSNQIILEKPDLVHLHNLHGYYCDIRSIDSVLRILQVPVIITMHDLWLCTGRCAHPPNGFCSYFFERSCRKCPFRERYPAKWIPGNPKLFEKLNFLKDKTLVVPSQWMASKVELMTGMQPLVIPNGIDKSFFHPYETAAHDSNKRLLAIASKWTTSKGRDDLIKIADTLPSEWTFTVVGNIAPNHPKINKTGYLSSKQKIANLIANSTALVSVSHEESFGLTVAEALAMKKPVIVRKNTAPEEMISDKSFVTDFVDNKSFNSILSGLSNFSTTYIPIDISEMAALYYKLYTRLLNSQ